EDVPRPYREFFKPVSGGKVGNHRHRGRVALARRFSALEPYGCLAIQRQIRRHLLPQRDDLFRCSYEIHVDRSLRATTASRRLALYRSIGIGERVGCEGRSGRPHHVSAGPMTGAEVFADSSNSLMAKVRPAAGRRFFDAATAVWMMKVFPGEFYLTKEIN